jgi:hypothetical protein
MCQERPFGFVGEGAVPLPDRLSFGFVKANRGR